VPALVLIVVAFNAPIATMAGFAQLAVGFGNGIGAPVSFLVAGLILLLFSVGFVGMSRYIKNPGAFYRFIIEGMGKAAGLGGAFLASAAYILLAAGSYVYMGLVAVDLNQRLLGTSLPWQVWTLIFVVIITVLGLLRVDLSVKVLGTLVCFEVVLVAAYELIVMIKGGPEGYSPSSWTPHAFLSGTVGLGILFAMLCMIGIEAAACFRDETRNPDKAVGRATYTSIAFMAVFYGIGVWAYIITQGASHAVASATTDPVGSFLTSVQVYLGNVFVNVVAIILVTSQVAATNAIQGAASRYLFNLGRDRVLPWRLARVHPRLQSPYVAVLTVTAICVVILAVVFLFHVDAVAAVGGITGMGIYFLLPLLIATSAAVVIFYRKHPELSPGLWTSTVAPVLALIGLAFVFILTSFNMTVLIANPPLDRIAQVGVVAVAVGGILLALRYKKTRPEVYESIGNQ
jgi:amino acid transporter